MADAEPKVVRLNWVTDALEHAKEAPEDRKGGPGGGGSSPTMERAVAYSDDALALEFTNRHDGEHLYGVLPRCFCSSWGDFSLLQGESSISGASSPSRRSST